jgi:2-methylcitrate dehydratase PrpD
MMHGGLDCLAAIISKNDLQPQEIESVHAYLEASCVEPIFSNRDPQTQVEAQFSVAYNMAVMAFGIKPGIRWQAWETMHDPEIRRFMDKVTFEPHPGYVDALKKDAQARISKVEVSARGKSFVEETHYIKGTPSSNPATYISDDEIIEKFKDNAHRILPPVKVDELCKHLLELDSVDDISAITPLFSL